MADTLPPFIRIPATETLSTHMIRYGAYPLEQTRLTFCSLPDPGPARRLSEGMRPLDSRREILSCREAFKVIVGT